MGSTLCSPVLKGWFKECMIDIMAKIAGGSWRCVGFEDDSKCLEHGAASGIATEE